MDRLGQLEVECLERGVVRRRCPGETPADAGDAEEQHGQPDRLVQRDSEGSSFECVMADAQNDVGDDKDGDDRMQRPGTGVVAGRGIEGGGGRGHAVGFQSGFGRWLNCASRSGRERKCDK